MLTDEKAVTDRISKGDVLSSGGLQAAVDKKARGESMDSANSDPLDVKMVQEDINIKKHT